MPDNIITTSYDDDTSFNREHYNHLTSTQQYEAAALYAERFPISNNPSLSAEENARRRYQYRENIQELKRRGRKRQALLGSINNEDDRDAVAYYISNGNTNIDNRYYTKRERLISRLFGQGDGNKVITFDVDNDPDGVAYGFKVELGESFEDRMIVKQDGKFIIRLNDNDLRNSNVVNAFSNAINNQSPFRESTIRVANGDNVRRYDFGLATDVITNAGRLQALNSIMPGGTGVGAALAYLSATNSITNSDIIDNLSSLNNVYNDINNRYKRITDFNEENPATFTVNKTPYLSERERQIRYYLDNDPSIDRTWATQQLESLQNDYLHDVATESLAHRDVFVRLVNYEDADENVGNFQKTNSSNFKVALSEYLRTAVEEKRVRLDAGEGGGRTGVIIYVNAKSSDANNSRKINYIDDEGDEQELDFGDGLTLFVPGLVVDDATEMANQDPNARILVDYSDCQRYNIPYEFFDTEEGRIENISDQGGYLVSPNGIKRFITKDEVKSRMMEDILLTETVNQGIYAAESKQIEINDGVSFDNSELKNYALDRALTIYSMAYEASPYKNPYDPNDRELNDDAIREVPNIYNKIRRLILQALNNEH